MTSENVHPIQQALIASRYLGYCVSTSLDGKETAKIPALDLEKILKGLVTFAGEDFPLAVALKGGNIKQFAGQNKIMLEVLADGINEKAADCLGDNILELEDDMVIYEEYRAHVAEMVG